MSSATVELRDHLGRNVATGRQQRLKQYEIRLDGRRVGYVGWKRGSKICLFEPVGPIELEAIRREVAAIHDGTDPGTVIAPDVPDEILNPPEDDELYDDFD